MARVGAVLNSIDQPLYDSVLIPAAATSSITFFSIPQGAPGSAFLAGANKTLADTNMTNAGVLPAPQRFECRGLQFRVGVGVTVANLRLIVDSGVFNFVVGSKSFLACPALYIPAAAGLFGNGSAAAATEFPNNGLADPRASRVLSIPIPIDTQENFSITLSWPVAPITLGAATPVQLFLLGTLYRSVQ